VFCSTLIKIKINHLKKNLYARDLLRFAVERVPVTLLFLETKHPHTNHQPPTNRPTTNSPTLKQKKHKQKNKHKKKQLLAGWVHLGILCARLNGLFLQILLWQRRRYTQKCYSIFLTFPILTAKQLSELNVYTEVSESMKKVSPLLGRV
jgi:hypothetical protein